MQAGEPSWYCARTKPKHEHIAADNLRKNLGLKVFHPRLRIERATQRGAVSVVEPLFPCYIFVHCAIDDCFAQIQHSNGISSLVRFGNKIPRVEDSIIEELQECFETDEMITVDNRVSPGDEVTFVDGAFSGMRAMVLRNMPARQRVQVLLDVLGRPTPVEVERASVVLVKNNLADLAPVMAMHARDLAVV